MVKARFFQNERKMLKMGHLEAFNKELETYMTMEYAHEVPAEELNADAYYLPVQGVVKLSSTSTKIRPVFDGSAKTTSGSAVNDLFLPGPSLKPLISDVLLKFRAKRVGITSDISKIYREVKLERDDTDLHRFFCRTNDGKLTVLRMSKLTFGIRPSPFVATSILRFHSKKYVDSHPAAAQAILQSFYVDDFISGANTAEEAVKLQQTLCQVLREACLKLCKWRSSSKQVLESIPEELRESDPIQEQLGQDAQKALGIHWHTEEDALYISTPTIDASDHVTKRMVARGVASLYDVMGLVAPYHMTGKILLQTLWAEGTKWDQDIPQETLQSWRQIIRSHPISRFAGKVSGSTQLHGFSDSSNRAYAAVIYIYQPNSQSQVIWC